MKNIYEIRYKDYNNDKSKSVKAYSKMDIALCMMKKLNALHGSPAPYYVVKKVIE